METTVGSTETRSERRKRQTHEQLVAAARELLIQGGPAAVTSREVAATADVAVGTFYNHFETIDDVIAAVVEPLRRWARDHGRRILDADDYAEAMAEWVADFLVRLERDGRDLHAARMSNVAVLDSEDELVSAMRARWGEADQSAGQGIAPGAAGPVMTKLMCMCGDLYGGRPMSDGTAAHLARMIHSVNTDDVDQLEHEVALTLDHRRRLRMAPPGD